MPAANSTTNWKLNMPPREFENMPRNEGGYVIEETSNKFVILLLVVNLITTLGVGYTVYKSVSKEYNIAIETPEEDKKFKENVYRGLSMIMQGQSQLVRNQQDLNIGLLRVHHFVEPHAEKFYQGCPECEKEKEHILKEEKESVTAQ